jgi:hypothetical protein
LNVADFALRVTHAIGIDAATANSASSQEYTLFLSWLNEAVVQFLRKTKVFKRTAALAVTASQGDYNMDTDVLAFEDVTFAPSGGTSRSLTQIDTWQIRDMRLVAVTTTDPEYYAYEGQTLMLYPSPRSSSDQLHILYVPRPAALAATGDAPSVTANGGIPAEYHPVLESYVKWKAAQHANDKASGNGAMFQQEFEQGCVEARVAEQRKAGMRIGAVNIGRGRSAWTYASPGVDLG